MVSMVVWPDAWSRRLEGWFGTRESLDLLLGGADQVLWEADQIVDGLSRMEGIGYITKESELLQLLGELDVLKDYVVGLPGELSDRLDHRLFERFANGPVEALSRIRTQDITTENLVGLRGVEDPGSRGWFPGEEYTPQRVSFDDVVGAGDTISGDRLFTEFFTGMHAQWAHGQSPDGEPVGFDDFVAAVLSQGEFDHRGYHPVEDAISSFLDATIVWALFKSVTGYDPITGEDLSEVERLLGAGFALIDALAIVLALPTGMGSLAGVAGLRVVAGVAGREIIFNSVAAGAGMGAAYVCDQLGLPSWVGVMAGIGLGFTVSFAGSVVVIKWAGETYPGSTDVFR